MAWEEVADETGMMTSNVRAIQFAFGDLIENYMAWRLLKAEVGHVFFSRS
jgi:hypothetical protein